MKLKHATRLAYIFVKPKPACLPYIPGAKSKSKRSRMKPTPKLMDVMRDNGVTRPMIKFHPDKGTLILRGKKPLEGMGIPLYDDSEPSIPENWQPWEPFQQHMTRKKT